MGKTGKRKRVEGQTEPGKDVQHGETSIKKRRSRNAKDLGIATAAPAGPDHSRAGKSQEERKKERRQEKEDRRAQTNSAKLDNDGSPGRGNDKTGSTSSHNRDSSSAKEGQRDAVEAKQASYTEDTLLASLPQVEIDQYLIKNHIKIHDPAPLLVAPHRPLIKFSYLPSVHSAPSALFHGFKSPTPIQAAAWPFLLSARDVIGIAETGSGKTLAFAVPCIHAISRLQQVDLNKGPRALIVSPTRELAMQSYQQILELASPLGIGVACVYGGVAKDEQRKRVGTADVIVATPGRLNDLINECYANLSQVTYLVLDEADRMLDKGFEDDIRKIISATSTQRQTLMFTATWPESVRTLAASFMSNPVRISVGDSAAGDLRANARIVQKVEVVEPRNKEYRLLQLLKQYQISKQKEHRVLVFCLYKKEATRVEGFIRSKGFRVASIHGDLSQEQRTWSLEGFKQGTSLVLVATDVAARGLDIPDVNLVINCTFPLTVEDYVHRIGRTGRAGKEGKTHPSSSLLHKAVALKICDAAVEIMIGFGAVSAEIERSILHFSMLSLP